MPGLRSDDSLDSSGILSGKDLGKSGWSDADIARQIAFYATLGADYGQTRTIAKNPTTWKENNPLLGSHPSTGKVNNYFLATALAHGLLMDALPPDYRKWAQYLSIGVEGGQARANKMLGVGFTF